MHPSFREIGSLLDQFHGLVADGFVPPRRLELPEDRPARVAHFVAELAADCERSGLDPLRARAVADTIGGAMPRLAELLCGDAEAALENDPAAATREEVEACYPGYRALVAYRLAHAVRQESVPMLPRMLTEFVHGETGIDIHPGAQIGGRFFIDHGTGVVIGETTVIGDCVTVYQGVTLGARNFPKDAGGRPIRGTQRHPRLGDDIVIYANATLLGGEAVIGDRCVIGAGVTLDAPVPPDTLVVQEAPTLLHRKRRSADAGS